MKNWTHLLKMAVFTFGVMALVKTALLAETKPTVVFLTNPDDPFEIPDLTPTAKPKPKSPSTEPSTQPSTQPSAEEEKARKQKKLDDLLKKAEKVEPLSDRQRRVVDRILRD